MKGIGGSIPLIIIALFLLTSVQYNSTPAVGQSAGTDKISPFVSYKFVQSSQNIQENEIISLRDIFYYVSILNLTGQQIQEPERSGIAQLVHSYQNADGGYGDWQNDRSKAGSTLTAIRTLFELGERPINETGLISFLNKLQVSGLAWGNYGFRSSLKETDADISSTHDAIQALGLIGGQVPNQAGVIYYIKDHQNIDGGFGYQTNRDAGIIWDSTILHSQRGLLSLSRFNEAPTFDQDAVDFIHGNQQTSGGFRNYQGEEARVSYTYNAIFALISLGETIPRENDVIHFLSTNQMGSGGFLDYSLDTKEGLHTTFFAISTIEVLGGNYNKAKAAEFSRNFLMNRLNGGFGDYPGLGSNSRITFDAVSILNRIGRDPRDETAVIDYVLNIHNVDGGYGQNGLSNVETTYRSILTLQLLEEPLPDPLTTVNYIRNLQNNDGGFGFASEYVSRGSYSYRAIRTLDILGREPIDRNGAVNYLRSLQNSDGGFGNFFGEGDSDISSSYRAVRALSTLSSSPLQRTNAVNFFKGSQNENGGFKRSPSDLTAPNNFSTSLFTYGAVLGLHYLEADIDEKESVYLFLKSLRNPDLGFGEKKFFTSSVSDTFTSIWSYMVLFQDQLDPPSRIEDIVITPSQPTTADLVNITVKITDIRDQSPEYVHASIHGAKYLLQPIGDGNFSATLILPSGTTDLVILTSDGINQVRSSPISITVTDIGNSPKLVLDISPDEGLEDTIFQYNVEYTHPDGIDPSVVQIQINDGIWIEIGEDTQNNYTHSTTLSSGIHSVRARAFDGTNYGYTDRISGPFVHSVNSTRPEWDLFVKIRDLVDQEFDFMVNYTDVERTNHNGKLAWKVEIGDQLIFVSYDGDDILNGEDENSNWWIWLIIVLVILLLVAAGISVFFYMQKVKEEDRVESWEDEGK